MLATERARVRRRAKKDAAPQVPRDEPEAALPSGALVRSSTGSVLVVSKDEAWALDPLFRAIPVAKALERGEVPAKKAAPPAAAGAQVLARPKLEAGMATADLCEYFLSGPGLSGVLVLRRKEDGTWSATLPKAPVPYVLTADAVKHGAMPPDGQSALPESLARVIPQKYRYWAYPAEQAKRVREALVTSGLVDDDLVKMVDGEMRLCTKRYYLFEVEADAPDAAPTAKTLTELVAKSAGPEVTALFAPMAEKDWREAVPKALATEGAVVILSVTDPADLEEMVDLVVKADAEEAIAASWLIEHDDTEQARDELGRLGTVVKLDVAEAENRLFVTSLDLPPAYVLKADPVEVSKPFAGYSDFAACVADQKSKGYSDKTARAMCGRLQADAEGKKKLGKVHEGVSHAPKESLPVLTKGLQMLSGHPVEVVMSDETDTEMSPEMAKVEKFIASCSVRLMKAEESEERYVLGVVLEPETVDAQKDIYSEADVRKAAHRYMEQHRNVGLMHKGYVNEKVKIVESYLAPVDFDIEGEKVAKGTWLMGVHVLDDELWTAAKGGALGGFSIGGDAIRQPET